MTTPGIVALTTDAASLLRREGRPRVAEGLLRRLSMPPHQRPVVMVAGDIGSGKSQLVNALLRRRDLSAVGTGGVTGVPLSAVYADPQRGAVLSWDDPQPVVTDVESARAAATIASNPSSRQNVRAVQVGVPCPLLERLVVVDSPGIGGLRSGPGELVLQALRCVDALVFVTAASESLTDAELGFVRRAAAVTDCVLIALTKIDAHADWEAIRDADLELLHDQVPELADPIVVGLDSALAMQALDIDNLPRSAALRSDAGLTALEDALTDLVVDRSEARSGNALLRDLDAALADAERALTDQLEAITPEATRRDALEADRARLTAALADGAEWRQVLDDDLRSPAHRRPESVAADLDRLAGRHDEARRDVDPATAAGDLAAHLLASAVQLRDAEATRIVTSVEAAIGRIDGAASDAAASPLAGALSQVESLGAVSALRPRFGAFPGVLDVPGFAVPAFAPASPEPVAGQFSRWSQERCREAAETVARQLDASPAPAAEISKIIRAVVTDRLAQITAILDEVAELSAADPAQRDTAVADRTRRREALAKLRRRAEPLRT